MNKKIIKSIVPPFLYQAAVKLKKKYLYKKVNSDRRVFYLKYAQEFSRSIGGEVEAFHRGLSDLIANGENPFGEMIQEVLVAFTSNYKKDLFHYYERPQYNILFRFLQYPFIYKSLKGYVEPYRRGIEILGNANVLEYGCGIPYGLIEFLLTDKKKVKSITLIDLDLVHMDFTEFLIRKIAPELQLSVFRLRDTESFPELNSSYNFIFGKDIFEHLNDPEDKLRRLISFCDKRCICYFDFTDHGEMIHAHVSPHISNLDKVMKKYDFKNTGAVGKLTEFTRKLDG